MKIKRILLISLFTLITTLVQAAYPERPIELIYPWASGQAMSNSQIIANALSKEVGESISVISTPGAGGTKAFRTALSRPSDGYTIIDGYVAPLVLAPILGHADWSYNDFKPLHAGIANAQSIGIRVGDKRFSNFEELMAYGRENPGKLKYSSGSRNNLPHMVIAKLLQSYGVVAQNIPYSTDSNARKDLQSGIIDFAFISLAAYLADKDGFNIVLVMSDSENAKKQYDGAPSFKDIDKDIGMTGLAPMGWDWFLVKKDTPDDIYNYLNQSLTKVLNDPEIISKIESTGFISLKYTAEDYEKVVSEVSAQLEDMADAIKWEENALKELRK